jgi:uncharacterized protein (TIGR00369 family)
MQILGGKVESFEEGISVMSMALEEKHMNPNGVVHGGVVTTLMDEAAGHAIVTIRGLEAMAETPHATVDMSVSLLSGARVGDELVCQARTLRVGRAVAFAEAEVRRRGSDDLVAKGAFTYVILAKRNG